MTLRVAVFGAHGRMGKLVIQELEKTSDMVLSAALVKSEDACTHPNNHEPWHHPRWSVVCSTNIDDGLSQSDVVIDFSSSEGTQQLLDSAVKHGTPIVTGTTGLDYLLQERITQASQHLAILQAANTSIGVHALLSTLSSLSKKLPNFDTEIFEIHHRYKKDAPSGTALLFANEIAIAKGLDPKKSIQLGPKDDKEPRIGVVSARGGDCVGEHTIYFLGDGERIEITHRVTDRRIFAQGALLAAKWLRTRPPGRYKMSDVLL